MMDNRVDGLIRWAIGHGAYKSPKIHLEHTKDFEFGGVTDETIDSEDSLLSIPLSVSIDTKLSRKRLSPLLRLEEKQLPFTKDEESNNFNTDMIYLYLFLIHEKRKGKESFYHPYINSLPTSFPNFPLHHFRYSSEERTRKQDHDENNPDIPNFQVNPKISDILKQTNLLKSLTSLFSKLIRLHQFLLSFENEFLKSVDFRSDLLWSFTVFWSRAFPIYSTKSPIAKDKPEPTLLPFIDILNHQYGAKREFVVNHEAKTFTLRTKEDIVVAPDNPKVQVFNNYGRKSNDSFLQSYGFYIPNNPDDTFYLQVSKTHAKNGIESGVYLQRIDTNISPLHHLILQVQKLHARDRDGRAGGEREVEKVEQFLETIEIKTLTTLLELLVSKLSVLNVKDFKKSKDSCQENTKLSNLEIVLTMYRNDQVEILSQSITRIADYISHKVSEKTIFRSDISVDPIEAFLSPSRNNRTLSLEHDLLFCPKEDLDFLNELNDEEVKLSVFVMFEFLDFLASSSKKEEMKFSSFFHELHTRIDSSFFSNETTTRIEPTLPLILYEPDTLKKHFQSQCLEILDEVIGIREELEDIFTRIMEKCRHYYCEGRKKIKKGKEDDSIEKKFFNFRFFLYCFSIVERFSIRSFEYLYIIPNPHFFEPYSNQIAAREVRGYSFHLFLRESKSLVFYDPKSCDAEVSDEDIIIFQEMSSSERFRKYGIFRPNEKKDTFPIELCLPSFNEETKETVMIKKMFQLNRNIGPEEMKVFLERAYRFENENDVFAMMKNFIGQILNQFLLEEEGDVEKEEGGEGASLSVFLRFKNYQVDILKKNVEFCEARM